MSDELKIEDVKKSLEALRESVSKGHSSRGTNTTEVDTMAGETGATQVFHTASNSNPGTWAGSKEQDVPQNGATDHISENGTDYDGAKVMKSILAKLAKGQKLSPFEVAVVKGSMAEKLDDKEDDDKKNKNPFAKGKDEDKDMEKAKDCDPMDDKMDKSFTSNPSLQPGFEVSDFLKSLVGDVEKSLRNMERNIHAHIDQRIAASEAKSAEVTKSLANAVTAIGDASVFTANTVSTIANSPARGPKAVTSAEISKSQQGTTFNKAEIAERMYDGMTKGLIDYREVLKFDATGQVSDEALRRIGVR